MSPRGLRPEGSVRPYDGGVPAGPRARTTVAVAVVAVALAGCGNGSQDEARAAASASAAKAAEDCRTTAAAVVDSSRRYLDSIESTSSAAAGSGAATQAPAPPADQDQRSQELSDALADLRSYAAELGCDPGDFRDQVAAGLESLTAGGPVANAVLLQLRADTAPAGTVDQVPVGGDVAAAVAAAPSGATIELAAGVHVLEQTLVLLRGITLRGAGRDATVLRSSAPGGNVLVLTSEPVVLEGLALDRPEQAPGSVVSAAPVVTLTLASARVSGARTDGDGAGGIGVLLAAGPGGQPGLSRRTSFRFLDSEAVDNAVAGLVVGGEHRVEVARAVVAGSSQCGICFLSTSDGTVTGTTLDANLAGVVAAGDARPVLTGATVTGGDVGLQAMERSAPQVTGSTVTGSGRAAFLFADAARGLVDGTTCTDVEVGIVVGPQAAPDVRQNPGCRLVRGQ